jgi:hypothetical protein
MKEPLLIEPPFAGIRAKNHAAHDQVNVTRTNAIRGKR